MKKKITHLLATAAAASLLATQASALYLDISSVGDSGMQFNGDSSFDFFANSGGHVFEVNDSDGGAGDAKGLLGSISGMWTINPWVGNTATLGGSPGEFRIWDGRGEAFTADVDFTKIGTVLSGGVINGSTNLTNFAYAGSNLDLTELLFAGSATMALSFEIAQGPSDLTLGYLSNNFVQTTFSGDVEASTATAVPDGGTTAAMLGLCLLVFAGISRRVRTESQGTAA